MANLSLESIRRATVFAATVLFVAVLYWGRELLIPLAVAILVTHLGLLFWETRYVSATLAYPGLKPRRGDA